MDKSLEELSDGSTRDKGVFVHEETAHHAAERGQFATDKYMPLQTSFEFINTANNSIDMAVRSSLSIRTPRGGCV